MTHAYTANANSTLAVCPGATARTRADLRHLDTPERTRSWKPIPHHVLVQSLVESLQDQGVDVVAEAYCTMGRGSAKILGTLDLRIPDLDTPDFRMGLGLRAGNDRSCAVQFVAAARVFVCSNWCFSGAGGSVFLKKKHTSGLDIHREVLGAVEQYLERAGQFRLDLDRMRGHALGDGRAKLLIYDAFAAGILPSRLFDDVHRLYFDDTEQRDRFRERTLWSLNNAFTEAVKQLRPAPQHAAGMKLGRMFGRVLHEPARPAPSPLATIDGIDVFPPEAYGSN